MKRKLIFTAALLCVMLFVPLALFGQEFEMNGTVLVKYNGNAANVTIPEGITAIGEGAFERNTRLTSVTIPSSVISIGDGVFFLCSNLTSIIVDTQNTEYSSLDGILFNKNRSVLFCYPAGKQGINYTIPSSVISIGFGAFFGCINLTNITISSSVTSIGHGAFIGCRRLTNIIIPSSVTSIGNVVFTECTNLRTITISRRTRIGINAFPDTAQIAYSD